MTDKLDPAIRERLAVATYIQGLGFGVYFSSMIYDGPVAAVAVSGLVAICATIAVVMCGSRGPAIWAALAEREGGDTQ